MFLIFFILYFISYKCIRADILKEDMQLLNELPLDKLLRLKTSLQDLIPTEYDNVTATTPAYIESFGAQAMAMKGPPIKRGDYIEHKEHYSKISNIFSMSVTTLAFLAFGGYLLCLIVQAVRAKQMYNYPFPTAMPTTATFLVSAGIKKRPHAQFASYGRRRREDRSDARAFKQIALPPEDMFSALLHFCEGYAKWSDRYNDTSV